MNIHHNIKLNILAINIIIYGASAYSSENFLPEYMNINEAKIFNTVVSEEIKKHPTYFEIYSQIDQSNQMVKFIEAERAAQLRFEVNSRNSLQRKFENSASTQIEKARDEHRADASLILEKSIYDSSIENEILKRKEINNSDLEEKENEISKLAFNMILSCQKTAYYQMLLNSIKTSIKNHQDIVNKIALKVESGRTSSSDLSFSKARLAEINAKKMSIELKLRSSESEYYQYFSNSKPCKKFIFVSDQKIKNNPIDYIDNNPLIRSSNYLIRSQEYNLEQAKSGLMPKIKAQIRGDRYDLTADKNYDISAGINFTYDIYTGGKRSSNIQSARSKLNESRYKQEIIYKQISLELEENINELNSSSKIVNAYNEAFQAYLENKESIKLQFDLNNASLLEILQSERDFLNSLELMIANQHLVVESKLKQLFLLDEINSYFEIDKQRE